MRSRTSSRRTHFLPCLILVALAGSVLLGSAGEEPFVPFAVYVASKNTNGKHELYVCDRAGKEVRKLSGDMQNQGDIFRFDQPDETRSAVWQEDFHNKRNRLVAFIADKDTDDVFELYVVPIEGGEPLKVSGSMFNDSSGDGSPDGEDGDVVWFEWGPSHHKGGDPDFGKSRRLAYRADQDFDGVYEIYVVTLAPMSDPPVISEEAVKVSVDFEDVDSDGIPDGSAYDFRWAPSAQLIGYRARVGGTWSNISHELFVASADGLGSTKISGPMVDVEGDGKLEGSVKQWAWDPGENNMVAYRADQDTDEIDELYISRLLGYPYYTDDVENYRISGEPVPGGRVRDFAWSPPVSGRPMLAYRADQEYRDTVELFVVYPYFPGSDHVVSGPMVDADSDGLPDGDVEDWAWSPDGFKIAYLADQTRDDVIELSIVSNLVAGHNYVVSNRLVEGGDVHSFAWKNTGTMLAYVADQDTDGVNELYAASTNDDPFRKKKISKPMVPGGNVVKFSWHPVSTGSLAYLADQDTDEVFELYLAADSTLAVSRINGPLVAGGQVEPDFKWEVRNEEYHFTHIAYRADEEVDGLTELFASRVIDVYPPQNTKVNGNNHRVTRFALRPRLQ